VAHRILLDTSSVMYRAFFSTPPTVVNAEGKPVNAVHGYIEMVSRLSGSRRPEALVHVYDDDWRPAPRVAVYAGYKANRPPDPDGLPEQFEVLRELLDALGQPQADAPGWEAEDAIGALTAKGSPDERFDIVTGDRDLLQLVRDPAVRVLFTLRGVTDLHVFDEAGVLEKYGVPAGRYADFATLRGDPSDGLPGVRGVGEKTARALVKAYPSLEAMVADATAPKRQGAPLQRSPSLRSALANSADYLREIRGIVAIKTDVEVRTWQPDPDPERAAELAERYRVEGPVRRFLATLRPG
jgi:5'-3' exonuclease